jgi:hypothetical protein
MGNSGDRIERECLVLSARYGLQVIQVVVPDWLRRRFTMADEQQDSDALKKLTEENAILEQQIQLFTKR